MFSSAKTFVVPLFGVFVLATSAIAQSADQTAADQKSANQTSADQTDQADATGAPTPLIAPQAESEQPVASPSLGQGTKAEAEHSAEATARKSLNDPNNQLGTSLQGRTRPIVAAAQDAPAVTPPDAGAQ